MSEASQALQRIARGTGIIFAGTIVSMLLGFLNRAIIARYFSVSEYGVFNLALTVLSIALVIATLGFPNSLPREVAFYRERDPLRVKALISTALIMVTLTSMLTTVILLVFSKDITSIFHDERLLYALKVMAFALPFSALQGVIISITQGFSRVREGVYFQNILYPTTFLLLVFIGAVLRMKFTYLFFAYVVAQVATFLALIFDLRRIKLFEFESLLDSKIGKDLIMFSLPLLFSGILSFIMNWTDTLMLGYYKSSEFVGLYNAASTLARLLPIFLNSAAILYNPIVSQLYAQNKIEEMRRVYQILTKWIFLLTLPIFSVIVLFPEATIGFVFGDKYLPAARALQILALGFMFHTFLGLNGLSLVIIKDSTFISVSSLISATLNVLLNALLIPTYGIDGAATATAVSYVLGNVLNSLRLYQRTKIHPFSWNYVKPLVISVILLGVIKSMHLRVQNIWYAVPILIVFLGIYLLLVLLSKSIDKEDVELFLAIEKRLGIDLKIIKSILMKFV